MPRARIDSRSRGRVRRGSFSSIREWRPTGPRRSGTTFALHAWDFNYFKDDTSRLMHLGLAYDVVGVPDAQLDPADVAEIVRRYPRLKFKDGFNELLNRDYDNKQPYEHFFHICSRIAHNRSPLTIVGRSDHPEHSPVRRVSGRSRRTQDRPSRIQRWRAWDAGTRMHALHLQPSLLPDSYRRRTRHRIRRPADCRRSPPGMDTRSPGCRFGLRSLSTGRAPR